LYQIYDLEVAEVKKDKEEKRKAYLESVEKNREWLMKQQQDKREQKKKEIEVNFASFQQQQQDLEKMKVFKLVK